MYGKGTLNTKTRLKSLVYNATCTEYMVVFLFLPVDVTAEAQFSLSWEEKSFQILLRIRNSVQREPVLCRTMKPM